VKDAGLQKQIPIAKGREGMKFSYNREEENRTLGLVEPFTELGSSALSCSH
jgi:hypothetical protein